jgi:DNA polymerase-1
VRTKEEEALYDGYDKTWRQLFNHVAQGGTADIVKLMMIRCKQLCSQYAARLLIQIHDELVFEVPDEQSIEFALQAQKLLSEPPIAGFDIPIVVEPKIGKRFGEMKGLAPDGV